MRKVTGVCSKQGPEHKGMQHDECNAVNTPALTLITALPSPMYVHLLQTCTFVRCFPLPPLIVWHLTCSADR